MKYPTMTNSALVGRLYACMGKLRLDAKTFPPGHPRKDSLNRAADLQKGGNYGNIKT